MTAALILAAGSEAGERESRLTGDISGASPLRRLIMLFRQAGAARIVVVTGHDADRLERHCAHMGAVFLQNVGYESGDMLASVKLGLEYLKGKCSRVFIAPAGIALFSVETLKRLLIEELPVVIPSFSGKAGHPLLLAERVFDCVLSYGGAGGLEGAVRECGEVRGLVEVSDRGILLDVRDDADYDDIVENHSLRRIRPGVKLWLAGEKGFFGPGTLQLLTLAGETGSLKLACRQMGVSYSKAWKVVSDVESQLGYRVILRRQGGRDGGGIELTWEGRELIESYLAFERESRELVQQTFDKYFALTRGGLSLEQSDPDK